MENKINHKKYVGQTNDFKKRMNGHRSDSNNKNSRSYNTPLSNAIRKYGWDNFSNYIVEEMPNDTIQSYVDEREKFFIQYYKSLTKQDGYNITIGGGVCAKPKLTYEEKLRLSKIFVPEEIIDIQSLLKAGTPKKEILKKYPRLTDSFLSNINAGLNYKNDEWVYPLFDYEAIPYSKSYSQDEIDLIKKDIISGMLYDNISKKWSLSRGAISLINNGKMWKDENYTYPLCIKGHSRLHNLESWVNPVQYDLIYSNLTISEIAEKYGKARSTISKISSGWSYHNDNYIYPLILNRTQNRQK